MKQEGLQELCCLIHDSQTDKKQFVLDLKETYEAFLGEASAARDKARRNRNKLVNGMETALAPVAAFNAAMTSQPEEAGISLRALFDKLIELRNHVPELLPRDWERVCNFVDWHVDESAAREFNVRLRQVQTDEVFANHTLCLLSDKVLDADQPIKLVTECVEACIGSDQDSDGGQLTQLFADVEELSLPSEVFSSLQQLRNAVEYAEQCLFLSEHNLLDLLNPQSSISGKYQKHVARVMKADKAIAAAQLATSHWRTKLTSEDTRNCAGTGDSTGRQFYIVYQTSMVATTRRA